MNIGHGEEKSSGPDLLLSYHDNDHYSSVRDATASKAKPKVNGDEKLDSEDSKTGKKPKSPTKSGKSNENDSQSNENAKNQSDTQPLPPKKNDLCPCGSGKKFKRCCWTAARQETRVRKGKGSDDSVSKTQESNDDSFEMNGNFRVLTI
jgi:SEC-C motif